MYIHLWIDWIDRGNYIVINPIFMESVYCSTFKNLSVTVHCFKSEISK